MKRKVKTSTRDKDRKLKLIKTCLKGYPEGLSPKLIALRTGLNVNSVKSSLPKIAGVKKVMRGLYKVVDEGDGTSSSVALSDWNFHNLILTADCVVGDDSFDVDFGTGKLVVSLVGGRATCRLSSDYPLNVSSVALVSSYFSDLVSLSSPVMVSTVEFNHDFKGLRLDGVSCISVDSLVSQFKAYQKRLGLRLEHKTKVPISVESVVGMLQSQVSSVDLHVKLDEQLVVLRGLSRAVDNSGLLLRRLLEVRG